MVASLPPRPANPSWPANLPETCQIEIEKFYIQLFFDNLYLVHPILDRPSFLSRCAEDIWHIRPKNPPKQHPRRRRHTDRFTAVYYAVAALGAIVAPEDALAATTLRSSEKADDSLGSPSHSSLAWAKFFFRKAQSNLGDVIQVCSLESTQALFLLVCHFCWSESSNKCSLTFSQVRLLPECTTAA